MNHDGANGRKGTLSTFDNSVLEELNKNQSDMK